MWGGLLAGRVARLCPSHRPPGRWRADVVRSNPAPLGCSGCGERLYSQSVSLAVLEWKRDVAQPGSAPEWGSGGRGFKSRRPDFPRFAGKSFRQDFASAARFARGLWSNPAVPNLATVSHDGGVFYSGENIRYPAKNIRYSAIRCTASSKFLLDNRRAGQYFVLSSEHSSGVGGSVWGCEKGRHTDFLLGDPAASFLRSAKWVVAARCPDTRCRSGRPVDTLRRI
jgi:hypothetical protein